jgi:hypothetical protein
MNEEELAEQKAEQLANLITIAQQRKGDLKKSDLVKIAKDMNAIINPKPPLRTRGTVEDILSDIVECTLIVEEADTLEQQTLQILNHLGLGQFLADAKLIPTDEIVDVNAEPEQEDDEPEKDVQEDAAEEDTMVEDDEPEEEDDAGPIITDEDLNPEDGKPLPRMPDEPPPSIPDPHDDKITIKDMSPEELIDYIHTSGVMERPVKRRKRDGVSTYMQSYPIFCKYYDMEFKEAVKIVSKEIGIEVNPQNRPSMQTAYSQIQKAVRYLKKYGHLPEKPVKKTTPRKTTKKE